MTMDIDTHPPANGSFRGGTAKPFPTWCSRLAKTVLLSLFRRNIHL